METLDLWSSTKQLGRQLDSCFTPHSLVLPRTEQARSDFVAMSIISSADCIETLDIVGAPAVGMRPTQ